MKKIFSLFLAAIVMLAVIFAVSCGKTEETTSRTGIYAVADSYIPLGSFEKGTEGVYEKELENSRKMKSEYNSDGNLVSLVYTKADGEVYYRYDIKYNKDGTISEIRSTRPDEILTRTCTYDKRGNLTEIKYEKEYLTIEAGINSDFDKQILAYDKNGRIIQNNIYFKNGEINYIEFSYDEEKRTVTQHITYNENKTVIIDYYSENWKRIRRESESAYIKSVTEAYHENGRAKRTVYYNNNGTVSSSNEYNESGYKIKESLYDENGKLVRTLEYPGKKSMEQRTVLITYYENENIKTITKYDDSGEQVIEVTEYDINGEVTYNRIYSTSDN